jgi:predicted N-acetyltransferase YhbS
VSGIVALAVIQPSSCILAFFRYRRAVGMLRGVAVVRQLVQRHEGHVGHPHFYPRFGFERASAHRLQCEWELPDEVFMVRILDATRMARVSGLIRFRLEFSTVT